ncbi:trigger factor family protein, partial [Bacillus sp. SS-TM]
MSTKWEKLEGNVGVLTIEVDAKEVNNSIDAAFKKVVKTINVPGFRKGKMPRPASSIASPYAFGKMIS